ncbi:MAG: hypothetical protein QNJ44_08985 [Rhodobacter sp.]|nr:hypothetical protein [Rhodobacter sp.]
MPSKILEDIKIASIDLADFPVTLGGAQSDQPEALSAKIAQLLTEGPGFAVAYNSRGALAREGLEIRENTDTALGLLESVFRGAMATIDFDRFSVVPEPMELAHMDVDGYNLNGDFSHDGKIDSRAFMTSKCIHFDAATPFVANTYGLNENIGGGHPLLCDVRGYCRDRGIDPAEVVEAIPNNYNVAIREAHYDALLDEYSAALDVDIDNDMIVVMLLNEVAYGVAHGATTPYKRDPEQPARRPLRHFEYQFGEEDHYVAWYAHYGVPMVEAHDYAGENLNLDYHKPAAKPYDRLVSIGV